MQILFFDNLIHGLRFLKRKFPIHNQQFTPEDIYQLLYIDELTGLPNQRKLKENLREYLELSRDVQVSTAVIVLNVSRFKAINDSLGYSAGDQLLQTVSARLTEQCSPAEQAYRMGEDEFAVIIPGISEGPDLYNRMEHFLSTMDGTVLFNNIGYQVSLNLGLAVFPKDGDSAEQLLQNADMAVHNAKEFGLEWNRYTPTLQMHAKSRLDLENEMRIGIEREEFFIEYQPQVHLNSGLVVGMEALVRWNHPLKGLLAPGEFIPLAEESGLIVPLGDWVLRQACIQNKLWQTMGYTPMVISVNLSMRQFRQFQISEQIGHILTEIGMDPQYLELEITESMTFDKEAAFGQLKSLKKLGVAISIDDFGTGYSSLHYLKSLPIDRLKIDRSFVKEVMEDNNDAAIVSTIASMARHLKLKVTAEGVENHEQLEFLKLQDCHDAQGYLFSKPLSAMEFEDRFLSQQVS
ncbi:diguanylate cyclase (GGDEF)-like protein [Paenibacillus shirakamiensis]|uniref:Diguanylate cyclase (GGDEF)-like protein n=1 Tax=Paenibacillus shirakamiensis TaxID=1265935 RepID=A0ABS4JFL1_9BACL|nr:bifunctional diguanylate cyclase/phosphodiesterase [Paenibacillus shirakamiensis]MBP2000483.1 diguanylate cyclase (GGDEF)-like protein [Paenibacillus shirakamiensis]